MKKITQFETLSRKALGKLNGGGMNTARMVCRGACNMQNICTYNGGPGFPCGCMRKVCVDL